MSISNVTGQETRIADNTLYDDAIIIGTAYRPDGPEISIEHEASVLKKLGRERIPLDELLHPTSTE